MANYVGLHLASSQARILEAEGTAKKLKIKRFTTVELVPPNNAPVPKFIDKEMGDVIGKAFSKAKISRDPVAMSWDSDLTMFREMKLPFTGQDQIEKVIKYEAESHLLNCDIDDVVVSFYKLVEERDASHLLVLAVRKDQLLNRLDILGRNGIDPIHVDLDVMASFNALSALGYADRHKAFMVLDCGRRTTNLFTIANGRLVSGRAIRLGADSVVRRIASDLDADPSEIVAETRALLADPQKDRENDLLVPMDVVEGKPRPETDKTPAELAHDLAVEQADGFYSRLSREVKRTLMTARLPEDVEVIYVTGPGSLLPGFAEKVSGQLPVDAPVERLNLLDYVDFDVKGHDPETVEAELLTPLGLAFKMAGRDDTRVDFRQEECRYARKFDQIREPLMYFSCFLLFFVLLLNMFDVKRLSIREPFLIHQKRADLQNIHEQGFTMFRQALGADAKLPTTFAKASLRSVNYMRSKMEQRIEELKGELGRGGAIPQMPSAFQMWKDTFDAIDPAMERIGKLWLSNMTISIVNKETPTIRLDGIVPSAAAYSDLSDALRKVPGVVKVEFGSTSPVPGPDGTTHTLFKDLKLEYAEQTEY